MSLDYEAKSSYAVTVNVADATLTGSTPVTVNFALSVTDVNEAPTNITLSSTSIAENQSSGTVVGNFSTTDVDAGNTFTYTLVSGTGDTDNGSFTISHGQLQTSASFDFEAKSSYTIRVRSTDPGSLTYEKAFTITVTDVNEAPTGVSLSNTTTSIAENTSTATRIKVADIVVADDALGLETITLTGADASSFEVDGLALYLKSLVSLDYENKASYAVTVNVADASLTGSTPVTVNFALSVTDVNEAPTNIALSSTSIAENQSSGTVVGNFSTTDVDAGNTFTYTLVSGTGDTDNGSFTISNGQLQTNASFDFETKSSYSIRVRSTDQGSLTYEKAFTITVTDVNEAPTGVSLSNTTTSIAENTSTATRI
ncbi:MAG: cadherin domain-containing protein, partial [Planctomycetia bacterium]